MPLTNAEKQARHRDRLKAKLERLAVLEAALQEIAEGGQSARHIARQALSCGNDRQPVLGVYRDDQADDNLNQGA